MPKYSGLKQQAVTLFTNLPAGQNLVGLALVCCIRSCLGSSNRVGHSTLRTDHPPAWDVLVAVIPSPGGTLHRAAGPTQSKVAGFSEGMSPGQEVEAANFLRTEPGNWHSVLSSASYRFKGRKQQRPLHAGRVREFGVMF